MSLVATAERPAILNEVNTNIGITISATANATENGNEKAVFVRRICKMRSALNNETALNNPFRDCLHGDDEVECSNMRNGFCRNLILRDGENLPVWRLRHE